MKEIQSEDAPQQKVHCIIVTYNPCAGIGKLISVLSAQSTKVTVVDNASRPENFANLKNGEQNRNTEIVRLTKNMGIAYAQNVGIKKAIAAGADFVLLSDQDSLPYPDLISRLLHCYFREKEKARFGRDLPGAVGPHIKDSHRHGDDLVYVSTKWGPRRAPAEAFTHDTVETAFLLASGCLIPVSALKTVGLMNESYFIDHVDLEWCLRARKKHYRTFVAADTVLPHTLGEGTRKIPLRRQPAHLHKPFRCYYLTRNTLLLVKSGLLNRHWKIGYLFWLLKFSLYNSIFADNSRERRRFVLRGIADGITDKSGALR